VAQQEGITYEDEALAVIAEKADGGMRDALSIFDQAVSFCQGNITYQKVIEDLNVLDAENYFQIVDLAVANKAMDIMLLLNGVINKGFDGGLLVQGLAKHVRNVLMAKDPQTLPLLEVSDQQRQRYQEQAKKCPVPFLYKALQLMNQCDINYRQSSNKRLLVELTLIEIAQITQPDEGAGSGRQPRRLKSLFKQLMQQPQPKHAARQVAAAEPAASTPQNHPQSAPTSTTPRIRKLASITNSWDALRQNLKTKRTPLTTGDSPTGDADAANQAFTQEDLQIEWLSMCNRMPQHLSGIATRMKNMNPVITELPAIEVTVDNQLALEQMEQIKGSIVSTLKRDLQNAAITLTLRVAEQKKGERMLSRREQYEQMAKENPSIGKLRDLLDLNLA
jgi:DNA polymerase-3 subunit gamma/tau